MNGTLAKLIRKKAKFDPKEIRPFQGKVKKMIRYINEDGSPMMEADMNNVGKMRQKTSMRILLTAGPKRGAYQQLKKNIMALPAHLRKRDLYDKKPTTGPAMH